MTKQDEKRGQGTRWRKLLIGCGITLGVLLIAAVIAWWLVSRHLGAFLSATVKEQADAALNGRLEFASLEIDLAGRAVMKDAAVYIASEESPVLTCPRVVVEFDLLNFIGPNRGRRAVVVTLLEPWVLLTREPSGSFNLARLAKEQPEEEAFQKMGVALHLRDATVDFTDWCLLDQDYPQLPAANGLAAALLDELGYEKAGAPEVPVFTQLLTVNGSILINAERQELSLNTRIDLEQPGGRLTVKGSASLDGSELDASIQVEELELASVDSYVLALFPSLSIGISSAEAGSTSGLPLLAGLVKRAGLQVQQQPGRELSIDGTCELKNLRFASNAFPELAFPHFTCSYSGNTGALSSDLELHALGCVLSGEPEFNLKQQTLAGKLKVDCADPAVLLKQFGEAELPIEGAISANITLAGTFKHPELVLALHSERLKFQQLDLGQLQGSIALSQSWLKLDKVQCSGGAIAFGAEGGIDTASMDGRIGLNAGPLPIDELLAVVNQLKDGDPMALDAKGNISAALEVLLKAGKPTVMLHAWSDQLTAAGQRFRQIDIRADVAPPNVNLKEATAILVLEQQVNLAGFTSDGPLQLALRAGGSVSTVPGQEQVALALVGEGLTKNLAPEAIRLSFKVLGSATDPEIRLQLKTTESKQPLVLSAQGYLGTGFTPWTASLLWQESTVEFAGQLDLEKQRIQGDVSASEVSLRRFSGDERLGGTISAQITVGGTFQAPTASGTVSAPQLTFATHGHTYSVDNLAAAVELAAGNQLKVSDGAFTFEGNKFTAAGVLGQTGGDLTLKCPDFDLFSILAFAQQTPQTGGKSAYTRPPLDIESAGPLTVRLSGELASPQAVIEYSSGPGQVAGHAFTGAELKAKADLTRAEVSSLHIASSSGSISGDGVVEYEPLALEATVQVQQFDVAVLAPLSGIPSLSDLKGQLNGDISIKHGQGVLGAQGWLELTGGSFQGVAITRARAELSTAGNAINIDSAVIEAVNTSLTASGKIGATPSQTQISARASSLDLALLAPFIATEIDRPFGKIALDLDISPSTGDMPQVDVNVKSIGGRIGAGEIGFDTLTAHVILENNILRVQSCNLVTGESSLNLTARLDLALFQKQPERAMPLDITLGSKNFNLSDARALLPPAYRAYVPGGVVSCENITVKGTTKDPNVTGELSFDISEMPANPAYLALVERVQGRVRFTSGEFDIRQLELTPVGSSGVGGVMRVSGSAAYSLSPLALTSGQLTLELAPGGKYMRLNTNDVDPRVLAGGSEGGMPLQFDGWLGGTVTISASNTSKDIAAIISGQLSVNMDGQTSTLEMPRSEKATGESQTIPVVLDEKRGLAVKIQSGTKLLYDRGNSPGQLDLRADLVGDLMLYGQPGQLDARLPHPFRIIGDLKLLNGTMRFYRHFIKLHDENSHLAFMGAPGEVYPYLTTKGSMVLPRVLTGNETFETSGAQLSTTPSAASSRDLTIFFAFTKHKLDPTVYYVCPDHPDVKRNSPGICPIDGKELKREDYTEAMQLSSEPPMSEDRILTYLLGGAVDVLTGSGDLGQFAEGELLGFGSSFISRAIADEFNLAALRLGGTGSDDNPYYIDMEKEITPAFSVTYYRDFFSETSQTEEYGIRYKILESQQGSRYDGIELELNFQDNSFTGPESEFMFTWTMRF